MVIDVATYLELDGTPAVDLRHFSVGNAREDFELRTLAWKLLGKLSGHPDTLSAMKEAELLR